MTAPACAPVISGGSGGRLGLTVVSQVPTDLTVLVALIVNRSEPAPPSGRIEFISWKRVSKYSVSLPNRFCADPLR